MVFVSVLAKTLSVLAKIILARKISTIAMSIYSLTLPTLSLLLNICQLGIPTTISKLIAKKKYSIFKIMQTSIIILLLCDLIIGTIYIFLVPSIATLYLKNPLTTLTLYGIVLLLPLVSLTSILKGYFIGIEQVNKTAVCQISEELSRLLFIVLFVHLIDPNNLSLLSFFAMFSTIIGEIASLIHLFLALKLPFFKLKKRITYGNEQNKTISKVVMKFSLMSTSTRLIGSIIYFFEPIIFTYLMLKSGVSQNELTLQYGIFNSYSLPLLLLPSFLCNFLSVYLLPKLSSNVEQKQYQKARKNFLSITLCSFLIGFISVGLISIFPTFFSKMLYGKEIGIEYLKKYGIWFSIYFLQMPIHSALIAFDKEKLLLFESIICNFVRVACFFIFIPKYLTNGMIIAIIISVYLSCIIHIFTLIRCFGVLKNKSKAIV